MKGVKSLLKYNLALPQMVLFSFHCQFKACVQNKKRLNCQLNFSAHKCRKNPLQTVFFFLKKSEPGIPTFYEK
eukprot:UN20132